MVRLLHPWRAARRQARGARSTSCAHPLMRRGQHGHPASPTGGSCCHHFPPGEGRAVRGRSLAEVHTAQERHSQNPNPGPLSSWALGPSHRGPPGSEEGCLGRGCPEPTSRSSAGCPRPRSPSPGTQCSQACWANVPREGQPEVSEHQTGQTAPCSLTVPLGSGTSSRLEQRPSDSSPRVLRGGGVSLSHSTATDPSWER